MADVKSSGGGGLRYRPYVPPETTMTEFSGLALLYGLVMSVILGAANAYLGLKAGMTIAATYPAAVISMALLRITQGKHSRGEHRAHHRLDRRIGRGRRDFHDPRLHHIGGLEQPRESTTGKPPRS